MSKVIGLLAAAFLLAGCLTAQERQSLATGAGDTLQVVIADLHAYGVDPVQASPEVKHYAELGCKLLKTSRPLVVAGVNIIVDRVNASQGTDAEHVTEDEYLAELDAACKVVDALLTPAPEAAPVPEPKPAA